ncbi:MAG TPA: phosphatase PAP2 family protein, partial [Solirubrobacterales bacterium]
EIPFDDPERLRARLRSRYPIVGDRVLGAGKLPNTRLQRRLARLPRVGLVDRVLTWTHWLWFFEPYVALAMVLVRNNERFPRAARQMAAVFDIGCAVYFVLPTAPPWWSSEQGLTGEEVRRIMVEVGEDTWGSAWPKMYDALGGNPWAAMPSLHFATSLVAALSLAEAGKVEGALGWTYAGTLGFALVYLGEHYVTDLLAGAALVAIVRRGEPFAAPLVDGVNRRLRRLERLASG